MGITRNEEKTKCKGMLMTGLFWEDDGWLYLYEMIEIFVEWWEDHQVFGLCLGYDSMGHG